VDSANGVPKSHSPSTRDEGGQKHPEDVDPLLMVEEKTLVNRRGMMNPPLAPLHLITPPRFCWVFVYGFSYLLIWWLRYYYKFVRKGQEYILTKG